MGKILIVDDSLDLLELFSVILATKGYSIRTAGSIEIATEEIQNFFPDLIILDVRLGGTDGREYCRRLKSISSHFKVVLVSGSPELLQDYKDCQADDVIEKPFDIATVIGKVDALLAVE